MNKLNKYIIILLFIGISNLLLSQNFTELLTQATGLPNYAENGKWVDFDNDNDLDLLIGPITQGNKTYNLLIENIGNHNFSLSIMINTGFNYFANGYSTSQFYFLDINKDGWIDLISNDSIYYNNFGIYTINVDSCDYYPFNSHFTYTGDDLTNSGTEGLFKYIYTYFYDYRFLISSYPDSCGFKEISSVNSIFNPSIIIKDMNKDGYLDVINTINPTINQNKGINTSPKFLSQNVSQLNSNSIDEVIDFNYDGYFDIKSNIRFLINDSCSLP
jgi:hypothetical protein